MSNNCDTGHGATAHLSEDNLAVDFKGIDLGEETITDVSKTHLGSLNYEQTVPGDLREPGEVVIPFNWNNEVDPVLTIGRVQVLTVTFPLAEGQTDQAIFSAQGYVKRVKRPNLQTNELQMGEITFKLNGILGPVYTPGSGGGSTGGPEDQPPLG